VFADNSRLMGEDGVESFGTFIELMWWMMSNAGVSGSGLGQA